MAKSRSLLRFATASSLTALGLCCGLACTLILEPDDAVNRCGSPDDCPSTGDNRYVAECRFDPGSDLDSTEVDKVCVAAFKVISCNPMDYPGEGGEPSPFQAAFADAESFEHLALCADTPGALGCPPEQGAGCNEGLEVRDGLCQQPGATAVYGRGRFPDTALPGQDVLDQFCRSFFCTDEWVCDTDDFTCVRCNDDDPYGQGGCGAVVSENQLSCYYTPNLGEVCDGPDADVMMPVFGNCGG